MDIDTLQMQPFNGGFGFSHQFMMDRATFTDSWRVAGVSSGTGDARADRHRQPRAARQKAASGALIVAPPSRSAASALAAAREVMRYRTTTILTFNPKDRQTRSVVSTGRP